MAETTPIAALRRRSYRALHAVATTSATSSESSPAEHTEAAGAQAAHTILDSGPQPTAVLAFNDRCAMGLLDTLIRAGIDVPAAISVVGYDDSPIARLAHIDLTTVSQRSQELTEHAVTALIERLDGSRTDHREVVLPPRLVIRGTTAPPPGSGTD